MSRSGFFRRGSRSTMARRVPEEVKHFIKSENDLIDLVKKCEPMKDEDLDDLVVLAKDTKFMLLRVYLLEKKEFYVTCL